jgi:hypothetical protein
MPRYSHLSWKVLEFNLVFFQALESTEKPFRSWNVPEIKCLKLSKMKLG